MTKNQNKDLLLEFHLNMFEYTGLPETVRVDYLEEWLQLSDRDTNTCLFRLPEDLTSLYPAGSVIAASATLAGPALDPYGEGEEIIILTRNGHEYRRPRNAPDVVLCYNNISRGACPDIEADAETLADIDISIMFLIFWTRLAPLLKVADDKQRQEVINACKNIKAGIPVTLVTQQLLKDLDISSDGVEALNLTQPDLADKIQYTARLREDILRWHYTRYGQTVQGDTKMAQQSVDEVNGTVSSSLIIPLGMLKRREEFIAEANSKFGWSASVQLSGPWRAEVTKYETETGEAEIDDTEPEEESEAAPEEEKEEVEENGEE